MSAAPATLAQRVTAAPLVHDPARAEAVTAALTPALREGALGALLRGAAGSSPYLSRSIERHVDWLAKTAERPPETALAALLAETAATTEGVDRAALAKALRQTKSRAALLIALADLGGVWSLTEVTAALSDLAEAALQTAVAWLLAEEHRQARLPGLDDARLAQGAGYTVIAMGKLGARELNYSSDIDLICLFDQDRYAPADYAAVKARFIAVTRALVKLLSDQTADGYVFRTDLRLRPTPSTTPVCLAMEAAERYYEAVGRTWERAAHIKARTVAGDIAAGERYLKRLTPFVWRRHLDFAAIEDIHGLLRKIRTTRAKSCPGAVAGHDIKLDPGGIREIEFFAQTRQLIAGGRDPSLREPTTLGALSALARAGTIDTETAERLSADYTAHRTLEHRLQMIGDAQTQTIPSGEDARARVAALSASQDRTAWETGIAARLKRVHASVEAFFVPATPGERAPEPPPDDDSLVNAGFTRPEAARALFERWTSGALPATRSPRARALFAHLQPSLIAKLARGASPDEAIVQFDRFLSGLPAGVQVFSLFCANPHLLDLVVEVSAIAPRLAGHLGRAPGVLDALLDPDFFEPLPEAETLSAELDTVLAPLADYERVLDAARRWAREQKFRAGVQVLRALSDEAEAARAHSAIAEACLVALLPRVEAEFARRHGPPPGRGMAVLALGKLGSREMTGGSDLDLIVIYDAPGDAMSEGRRPLAAAQYYPRLTQALVAAFSAPTAEGRLYEIDMRLRPSGRQGPVATSLAAFSTYQRETAWVWEHLALTRARVVAGAGAKACALGEEVASTVTQALAARRGAVEVIAQASTMRDRLIEAHQRERSTPWALKHTAGGLMEIEFLAQTAILYHGLDRGAGAAGSALLTLEVLGWLKASEGQHLNETLVLLRTLQQIERVALERPFDPETTGLGLRQAMARALEVANFDTLEHHLQESTTQAGQIIEHCFQRLGATD